MHVEVRTITQGVRGCGERQNNAFYIMSAEPSEDGMLPDISEVSPIPVNRKPHRGALIVKGDKILERAQEEDWYAGASADTQEKKKADAVALQIFGMTITKRLNRGDCKGVKTADLALAHLEEKVCWSSRVLQEIRQMSLEHVQEIPNCDAPFARLIRCVQDYTSQGNVLSLVKAAGQVWLLAEKCPPKRKGDVVKHCVVILALLGLMKDARELRQTYYA